MAANIIVNTLQRNICKIRPFISFRRQFTGPIIVFNKVPGQTESAPLQTTTTTTINANVPGLSTAIHTQEEPVGPGASKSGEYKVPEYFNFNKISYFEAEIEMSKYRCPQPSAVENVI